MASSQFTPDYFLAAGSLWLMLTQRVFRASGSNTGFGKFATCLLQPASRDVSG
jgi:hypothetical protein